MINTTPQHNAQNTAPYGYRLISRDVDDDCGCVEQEWETPVGGAFVHLLPFGVAEVFFDNGDAGEWEVKIQSNSELEFAQKLVDYVDNLPVIDI
jgi:hypothetical protein